MYPYNACYSYWFRKLPSCPSWALDFPFSDPSTCQLLPPLRWLELIVADLASSAVSVAVVVACSTHRPTPRRSPPLPPLPPIPPLLLPLIR